MKRTIFVFLLCCANVALSMEKEISSVRKNLFFAVCLSQIQNKIAIEELTEINTENNELRSIRRTVFLRMQQQAKNRQPLMKFDTFDVYVSLSKRAEPFFNQQECIQNIEDYIFINYYKNNDEREEALRRMACHKK